MHGTHYLFQASIAILRLVESDLLQLDLSGINDYLKAFKDAPGFLPSADAIIKESLKVKLDEEKLERWRGEYKQVHAPSREEKKKKKMLASVKQQAI